MLASQADFSIIETDTEDWGYQFLGKAIDSLLCQLEGNTAVEAYPDFRERRERGYELMFDLVGQQPQLFYIRRMGAGQEPGEEIWDLIIATDRDSNQFPVRLRELGKTLGFKAAVPSDGSVLRLLSCKLLPIYIGQADGYAVPYRVRLLSNHRHRIGIPQAALARIAAMPVCGEHVPTQEQLKAWKVFLGIEESIAKARQFCVPFVSHNYGAATRRITFEIDATSATLDGSDRTFLDTDELWKRAKQASHEDIKLLDAPTGNGRNSRQLGSIEEVDSNSSIIRVRLERDLAEYMSEGQYQLPATGFLLFQARGEIALIERKKKALEELNKGRTQNPYLGNFLFDASQARRGKTIIQLQPQDLLLPSANPSQCRAVEAVLAAPDLVLIQGPPGTGKTTVIAEICYQIARRGGRTLIASQANLAVDNALSRLIHNPVIRAVRKGKAEKVGEEGLPFLEERVIGTWLQNTADDCEKSLKGRLENVQVLRQLLAASERFTAYLKAEEVLKQQQDISANLESVCGSQANAYEETKALLRPALALNAELDTLLTSKPLVNWHDRAVIDLLARLQPYMAKENLVGKFEVDLNTAIQLMTELGIVPPTGNSFAVATWLRDRLPTYLAEVRFCIAIATDAATAMNKAIPAIQAYRKNVETCYSELKQKSTQVFILLRQLIHLPQVPEELRILAEQFRRNTTKLTPEQAALFSAKVHSWIILTESYTNKLENLITLIDPFNVIFAIKKLIQAEILAKRVATENALQQLKESQSKIAEIKIQVQQQLETVDDERIWWQAVWQAIPDRLKPTEPTNLFELDFLKNIKSQFGSWQKQLEQEETYLSRFHNLVSDWITRIRSPSQQDRNQLRRIYLDNANVIGITCVQAASRDFYEEFKSFDVVIIDEVSKCTPPELLIPALKGKKLVMVGDHRQLPPMLDTNSLEEVAQTLGSTRDELKFLEESLFKSQFEIAHESIKQMLNIQYRMHPHIMGAINQFYADNLQCGILDADIKRAHNLASSSIQEKHHIVWIPTPIGQGFEEQREGNSFFNIREIDLIEHLCHQMEDVWASRVAKGEPKKEIAVITFYGSQLRRIDRRLDSKAFPSLHIRTGTVDRFQGMERPVVIVSMVRNNRHRDVGFAKKPERVNVAFSRAQELLVIVGCHDLFTEQPGKAGSMYLNVSNVVRCHEGFIDVSHILC